MLTELTKVDWKRVPMSGGFATANRSEDPRFDGDVFTEDPFYKDIVIECKTNKIPIGFNDLFSKKSQFHKWVKQTEKESKGKEWALFIKINRQGTYGLFSNDDVLSKLRVEGIGFYFSEYFLVKIK